jgi:hypothetical protein
MVNKKIANLGKFIALFVMAGTIQGAYDYDEDIPRRMLFENSIDAIREALGNNPDPSKQSLEDDQTLRIIEQIVNDIDIINTNYIERIGKLEQDELIFLQKQIAWIADEKSNFNSAEEALKALKDIIKEISNRIPEDTKPPITESSAANIAEQTGLPSGLLPK